MYKNLKTCQKTQTGNSSIRIKLPAVCRITSHTHTKTKQTTMHSSNFKSDEWTRVITLHGNLIIHSQCQIKQKKGILESTS